ncbi:EAL domain-containing protein [Paraburkholderia domus]|uniref:EAL domain-containing protein n=1 Tax=Paraburkholderia domus TaxID=2793075 RepID=UPI001912410D|nr:EAL domain-containing protein [Paraburkholderia domus]MBK5060099.1 EAL domain-containing protein [Burkholderia sp. R-70199]MBK5118363.1 EAL domain-containing protein [Burkholderia sp. R-69980]MBK5179762.1 EAL domain-containing protein [Burkholderia sp. R-69749]MCI0144450.1 EAL domain-containing protein [Paraburkholderia sediminicola]CAE6771077.1 putative signaling protein [Paraburkholderia domus]
MLTLDYRKSVSLATTATTFGTRTACVEQTDWDDSRDDSMALSELEDRVSEGLRAGEFHLVFQGAYRAAGGAPARLEAQVRWTHPDYGLLLPGIFMMPLEHPQVAMEMALFVIDGVCRELRDCLSSTAALQPIAITVPAQVAVLESFADELTRIARSYGVPANLLVIEVPDSADAARLLSLRTLTSGLRSAGAGISLGKWGNGASSLALLGALDVDTVTIAPDLMGAVPRDPRACMVISALLDLLHSLDVQVVVNGVETKEQLQWLNSWPDALVQGFLLSRPKAGLANALALSRES